MKNSQSQTNDERVIALQGVVDRLQAWQETAPTDTIEDELDTALQSAGIDLDDQARRDLVRAISESTDPVVATSVVVPTDIQVR